MNDNINLNMDVDFAVAGKEWAGNIHEVLRISEARLSEEFAQQPSLYAWFAALCEMAGAEFENKKFALSVLRANTEARLRKELSNSGVKTTEASVSAAVQSDPDVGVKSFELIEFERQYMILKSLVRALDQRKDMLIQLGGMKRQEMQLGDFGVNMDRSKRPQ